MSAEPARQGSIYRHMLRGSAWGVAMRWSVRLIGLVSVMILARLLTPEDFGIMAIGALAMGLIVGMSELGTQMLVIREPEIDREHIDTAWTIKVLQGLFVGLLLIALAPLAAHYFEEPRAVAVMQILALAAIIEGAENIGMTLARRELDFAKDFRFYLYKRLFQFVVTVSLAFALRSYWALIIGQFCAALFGVAISFTMHAYRPRPCLVRARDYLQFAKSIVPFNVARFINKKVDVAVVGGIASTATVGFYNVAAELSSMVTQEIVIPVGRGLMPSYAKLTGEPQRLADAFRHVLSTIGIICFPIAFGLWAIATDFVQVVLGEQWGAVVPFIQWLAVYGLLTSLIQTMSGQILIVTKHERRSAWLMWLRVALLLPITAFAGYQWGVQAVAPAVVVSAALATPVVILVLTRSIEVTALEVVLSVWRPALAAATMLAVLSVVDWPFAGATVLALALDICLGALVYGTAMLALWAIAGQPQGVERAVLELIVKRIRHRPAV